MARVKKGLTPDELEKRKKEVANIKSSLELNVRLTEKIKYARLNAKMTQNDLAKLCEFRPGHISDIENRRIELTTYDFYLLCLYLKLDANSMLELKSQDISYSDFSVLKELQDMSEHEKNVLLYLLKEYKRTR